jgi:hypothetical protein
MTQGLSNRILYDVSFWHELLDRMPPALIKTVSAEGARRAAQESVEMGASAQAANGVSG